MKTILSPAVIQVGSDPPGWFGPWHELSPGPEEDMESVAFLVGLQPPGACVQIAYGPVAAEMTIFEGEVLLATPGRDADINVQAVNFEIPCPAGIRVAARARTLI